MIQKLANPERNAGFCHVSRSCVCSFEIRHPIVRCRNVRPAICEKEADPYNYLLLALRERLITTCPPLHNENRFIRCNLLRDLGFAWNVRIAEAVHASASGGGSAIDLMPVPCTATGDLMSFESTTTKMAVSYEYKT